ncbi:MAG TPA: FAD-binding oxidoreductase, partial [Candidatus Thermoplasmatota archaeon]
MLVVGAGIIGMASAFHAKREDPDAKVVVVDRNAACAQGNTARSAALVRNTFTSSTNLALADSSIDYYTHLTAERREQIELRLYGYLWLMDGAGRDANRDAVEQMRHHGVEVEEYGEDELRTIPGLRTRVTADEEGRLLGLRDIEYGLFGAKCGAVEPDLLTQVYERDFRAAGGVTVYNTPVDGLLMEPKEGPMGIPGEPYTWQSPRVAGARTAGGTIRARKTLVAAGAWLRTL